ncbi:hypothetical protein EVAR_102280_1 [Eumeta japonica]|uniref:Uncharacterized protein n=1 Tax=Eumeta variegata TaxID=151549 RepID=A0A4C1WGM6_EUMVA|nr:hypothetical protein EVAR_102280_1 [Eumeta japonica]
MLRTKLARIETSAPKSDEYAKLSMCPRHFSDWNPSSVSSRGREQPRDVLFDNVRPEQECASDRSRDSTHFDSRERAGSPPAPPRGPRGAARRPGEPTGRMATLSRTVPKK